MAKRPDDAIPAGEMLTRILSAQANLKSMLPVSDDEAVALLRLVERYLGRKATERKRLKVIADEISASEHLPRSGREILLVRLDRVEDLPPALAESVLSDIQSALVTKPEKAKRQAAEDSIPVSGQTVRMPGRFAANGS